VDSEGLEGHRVPDYLSAIYNAVAGPAWLPELSSQIYSEEPLEEAFKTVSYLGVVDIFHCLLGFIEELNNGEDWL
jgi:hypothetical protein